MFAKFKILLLAVLFLTACTRKEPKTFEQKLETWKSSSGSISKRLEQLYQIYWQFLMDSNPEFSTFYGEPGRNAQLNDLSPEAIEKKKAGIQAIFKALSPVSETDLTDEDLLNFRLFKNEIMSKREGFQFPSEYLLIDSMLGIQQQLPHLLKRAPRQTVQDFQDRISRLQQTPKVLEQTQFWLSEGLKKKVTLPKSALSGVPAQLDALINPKLEKNPLFESFLEMPSTISAENAKELQEKAQEVILKEVIPAFAKFKYFFIHSYLVNCRTELSWLQLPDGENWYEYLLQRSTTLTYSAEKLHKIGLKEVDAIQAQMNLIRSTTKFKDQKSFFRFLQQNPEFYFKNERELLIAYRDLAKRIDPYLVTAFPTLPRLPLGIESLSAHLSASAPNAYYQSGSYVDWSPGLFLVNTHDLNKHPKWALESLFLHEGNPGHHLQSSLAMEFPRPAFRYAYESIAYTEGWALYAESLGKYFQLYKDPYSQFGKLNDEMLRAIRLVVETGIHLKSWSHQQAVQYFKDHGIFSDSEIEVEINRYISWPGQALAYKMGEMKIQELRKISEEFMGEKFDLREFHYRILSPGPLPMPMLEDHVVEWLKSKKAHVKGDGHGH